MLSGLPPFYAKSREQLFKNIVNDTLDIKPYFSNNAVSLLTGLLNKDPSKRLGGGEGDAKEIKNHIFFKEMDWEKLSKKEIKP